MMLVAVVHLVTLSQPLQHQQCHRKYTIAQQYLKVRLCLGGFYVI